jgi:hypothetical protein|tara:strand:- start:288 stop:467 length:180 start_codon:yes stop_codon:yes gene_type:complete
MLLFSIVPARTTLPTFPFIFDVFEMGEPKGSDRKRGQIGLQGMYPLKISAQETQSRYDR